MANTTTVAVKLEPEVVAEIDRRAGYNAGRRGGRAEYIRQCVYKALDFEPGIPWHERGTRVYLPDLNFTAIRAWHPPTVEAVKMLRKGMTFEQVADAMNLRGEKLPRGGRWTRESIYYLLKRARKLSQPSSAS